MLRKIMGVYVNAPERKAEPDWMADERRSHPLRSTRANAPRLSEDQLKRDEAKGGMYKARAKMLRKQYAEAEAAKAASQASSKEARLDEIKKQLE